MHSVSFDDISGGGTVVGLLVDEKERVAMRAFETRYITCCRGHMGKKAIVNVDLLLSSHLYSVPVQNHQMGR